MAQIKKSSNISYYHLSGEVEIVQERTLELRDRSSREGMIETRSYQDLVSLTKLIVDELQFQIQKVRDQWTTLSKAGRVPPSTIRADTKLASELSKALVERYDFVQDPLQLAKVAGVKEPAERLSEVATRLRSFGEHLKLQEEEREGLLEAAGFGLAIGVAVHEIAKLASAIVADVRQLRTASKQGSFFDVGQDLQRRAESLLAEVKRLAPLRVTRSEPPRRASLRSAIEAARNAFIYSLEDSQILFHIDGDDFFVSARFGALAQVFANLLDNSIYWIGTLGPGGALQFVLSKEHRTVLVADTGPGVSEKMRPHLFEPFYSEKSPRSGLGLFICRHYLSQCNATIRAARLSERGNLKGAQFILDFSKSPEGEERQ